MSRSEPAGRPIPLDQNGSISKLYFYGSASFPTMSLICSDESKLTDQPVELFSTQLPADYGCCKAGPT